MKRRDFFKAGAAGTLAAGGLAGAPAYAQGKRRLKMVTTWPKNYPGLGTGAARVARRITEMTDGRIAVTVYAAGELVPALSAFDAVADGTADMYHGSEYYWQGKNQAFNFFTAVPMGFLPHEHFAWIHFGGGQELWDELSARFNVKPFLAGSTGPQLGGWYKTKIESLEDLKGLRVRIPGLGGEVLRRLGAAAVVMEGGEIFPALQSGAIDAAEWVGPWNDLAFGFHKMAKHYYYPGFHEAGSVLTLGTNLDVWESLSAADQRIVQSAAEAENNTMLAEYNAHNADALRVLTEKHGVQLHRFPDAMMREFGRVAGEVLAEAAASDPMAAKVYDSFRENFLKSRRWTEIGTESYAAARHLDYPYFVRS